MTQHLFIVTSAINTGFGFFSREERIEQLMDTIVSIQEYAPGSKIAIFESSGIPVEEELLQKIKGFCHYLIDMSKDANLKAIHDSTDNWDIVKNLCEILAFYNGLRMLREGGAFEGIDRVHKVSGRYKINRNFDLTVYDDHPDKIVLCKKHASQFEGHATIKVNVSWQHCSRLWSWPMQYEEEILKFYDQAIREFTDRVKVGKYIDIEHMLYLFLPPERIHEVDLIGVWGALGQNGRFVSN